MHRRSAPPNLMLLYRHQILPVGFGGGITTLDLTTDPCHLRPKSPSGLTRIWILLVTVLLRILSALLAYGRRSARTRSDALTRTAMTFKILLYFLHSAACVYRTELRMTLRSVPPRRDDPYYY